MIIKCLICLMIGAAIGFVGAAMMSKVVDSQVAIDAINSHFGFNIEEEYGSAVQEVINSLPPAQPEIIHCKDCIHYYGEPGNPNIICFQMHEDDFCSYGERREK